jgi:putative Ca2+/H+ antiporter (TMEM165/GDT1 family)
MMVSWGLWLLVGGSIFLAELPDQSAWMVMTLAGRGPRQVWAGASLALGLQAAIAVAVGTLLHRVLGTYGHWIAGAVFLGFAVWLIWGHEGPERMRSGGRSTFWTAFVVVFLAEMGDLTQWTIAAWTARLGHPVGVFAAAAVALGAAAFVSVEAGRLLLRWVPERTLRRVAGAVFMVVGVLALVG